MRGEKKGGVGRRDKGVQEEEWEERTRRGGERRNGVREKRGGEKEKGLFESSSLVTHSSSLESPSHNLTHCTLAVNN